MTEKTLALIAPDVLQAGRAAAIEKVIEDNSFAVLARLQVAVCTSPAISA